MKKHPRIWKAVTLCVLLAALIVGGKFLLKKQQSENVRSNAAPAPTTQANASSNAPAPAAVPYVPEPTNTLFATPAITWNRPIRENAFAQFHDWAENYVHADDNIKSGLEAEGVALAQARREALKTLIETDPERALELTVPIKVRRTLPDSVTRYFEERVSARGDLAVMGALAEPGKEGSIIPTFRTATLGSREFKAFVYGRRLGQPTRRNIPLNGIAVDSSFAVNDNPVRVLDPEEASAAKAQNPDPICSISGQSANILNEEVAVDVGGETLFLCRSGHVIQLNDQLVAGEGGPPGPADAGTPAASTWTEGLKKVILIRVDFTNLTGVPVSDAGCISLIQNLHNFYSEMSYGKTGFYTNGAGSDFTPTFRMTNAAAWYGTNDYYNQLRSEARAAATAAGYLLTNYDRDVICMGAVPGFNWSGLAYVGAAGAWLRSSFGTGVAGHELGHNWGLNHANFWDTSSQSIIGPGVSVEYGDIFDTMGSASAGNNHFGARYKSYLNWLTTNDTLTVTSNGTYRVYAHDDVNSFGVRGLKIVKNSGTNYWVEFRQKFSSIKWLMNGAGLRWAGNGNERSQLLDTTPGSTDTKNDAAIYIGRTFSDKVTGIHVTPIGKGGTTPESLDVTVNLGLFPANQAPTLDVVPSATNAATGVALTFTANASDPDGDSLAYYWDFGDGNYGTNNSVVSKSWSGAGEYLVRCVASDMKGGEAIKSTVVTIGSPTTYRIGGQITTTNGPLQGVRVYVSTTRMAYTDSDGSYTIVGLPAGTYTVAATLENYAFTPSFTNPVSVGPTKTDINFDAVYSPYTAPVITNQPANLTVNVGSNVTFSVGASGTSLSYQWRFNGANISGATGATYTKNNVQATNAGNYSVVVSNLLATATSSNAVLTVNSPPVISAQPQAQTVTAGVNATFTVTAAGTTPFYYQWRFNGTNIAGANSSAYTRTNAQLASAGNYSVIVTNSLGAVTSSPALLTVNFTLNASATYGGRVAKTPSQQSYAANAQVTLTATPVSVFPFTGWTGDASGSNNPLIVTMTTNMNITANFTSPVADLIVDNPQAVFTGTWATDTAATNKYGADDRTAASTMSSATATGTFTPTVVTGGSYDVYVWYPTVTKSTTTVPFQISAANSNVTINVNQTAGMGSWQLLATNIQFAAGTNGYVLVSNNTGQSGKNVVADAVRWVYSEAQSIALPVITNQPQSQRVLDGGSATFTVGANGGAPLGYRWRFANQMVSGATNTSLLLSSVHATNSGTYDVIVTNLAGAVTSAPASLIISVPPTLNGFTLLSNGQVQLLLTGTIGDQYAVESSTNLVNWTQFLTLSNTSGSIQWTNDTWTNEPSRFYRSRLLP